MNNQTLKLAIADDIKTMKNLNPDIIPARFYYWSLFKLASSAFGLLFAIIALTLAYSLAFNTSNKTPATFLEIISSAVIVAFFLSLLATFALLKSINFFVIFRFHLEKKLKTGALLVRKFKLIATLFLGFFALFCALFGSYGSDVQILLMLVFSFFGSFGATYFLMSMELNRIGVSTMFTVINEFFHKGKEN